jgi:hypothetical protein
MKNEKIELNFTSEETFITQQVEFSKKHHDVAMAIHDIFGSKFPIIVRKDLESLSVFVSKTDDRLEQEKGINCFRITIEEIKNI